MCMAVIGVLYAIIFATILLRTPEVSAEQRRTSMHSAISYSVIVIPLLVYLVCQNLLFLLSEIVVF